MFGAVLISFLLTLLQKYITSRLVYRLLVGPASVFGGEPILPPSSSRILALKAAAIGAPFVWGTYFVTTVFYTTAFFITAAMVRDLQQNRQRHFRSALRFAGERRNAILGFSLLIVGLFAAAAIAFATAASIGLLKDIPLVTITYASPALTGICIAYLVTPTAMLRIANGESCLASASKGTGRIFSITTVLMSLLLAICLPYVERPIFTSGIFRHPIAFFTIQLISSLATALPYVALFIGLTLIVDNTPSSLSV